MKHFLILLLILFVLIMLYQTYSIQEGFQDQTIDPNTASNYKAFLAIYQPFLINWEKGISTMIALDQPQPDSTTSEPIVSSSPPVPGRNEINIKIGELSRETGTAFPLLTDPMPGTLNSETLPLISEIIPKDPAPYINAYRWLNSNLEKSHRDLEASLNRSSEGFAGSCEQVQQCTSDPSFIAKVTQAQKEQQQQAAAKQQKQLLPILKRFTANSVLQYEIMKNKTLMAKSEKIKSQAQSGELLTQYKSDEPVIRYTLPEGANRWKQMQEDRPEEAKQLKESSSTAWIGQFADWRDSINRNLR